VLLAHFIFGVVFTTNAFWWQWNKLMIWVPQQKSVSVFKK